MQKGAKEKSQNWKCLSYLAKKKMSTAMPQLAEETESSITQFYVQPKNN